LISALFFTKFHKPWKKTIIIIIKFQQEWLDLHDQKLNTGFIWQYLL